MERLTERIVQGLTYRIKDCGIRWRYIKSPKVLKRAIRLLGEYEDTGLGVENIKELILENEQLRMRLAEIPDLLAELDQETIEGYSLIYCKARHDTLSEVRRLLVD